MISKIQRAQEVMKHAQRKSVAPGVSKVTQLSREIDHLQALHSQMKRQRSSRSRQQRTSAEGKVLELLRKKQEEDYRASQRSFRGFGGTTGGPLFSARPRSARSARKCKSKPAGGASFGGTFIESGPSRQIMSKAESSRP